MNTEFPSRLPTIQNTRGRNNTTSSQASMSSEQDTSFRSGLLKIVQNMFNTLDNLSDSVNSFVEKQKTDKPEKTHDETNDKEDKKSNAFINFTKNAMESLSNGFKNLQSTLESTNGRIGSTIGGVFGGGLFSEVLGKIITKSLNAVIPKLLIGVLFSNPILLGIAAVVGLGLYFWREIWEGIKWIGMLLDQAIAGVAGSWLGRRFGGKNKYYTASEGLQNLLGLSEDTIARYFNTDTVRGRDRMLEEWRKAQASSSYAAELTEAIKHFEENTPEEIYARLKAERHDTSFELKPEPSSTIKEITNTYVETRMAESPLSVPSLDSMLDYTLPSPTVLSTNKSSTTYVSGVGGLNISSYSAPDNSIFGNQKSELKFNF